MWLCYLHPAIDNERRSQWLRGALDLSVLALLGEGEAYGYELVRALDERGLGQIQGGTLYPVLMRMERLDLVTSAWRTGRSGPARKYYRLTRHGVVGRLAGICVRPAAIRARGRRPHLRLAPASGEARP